MGRAGAQRLSAALLLAVWLPAAIAYDGSSHNGYGGTPNYPCPSFHTCSAHEAGTCPTDEPIAASHCCKENELDTLTSTCDPLSCSLWLKVVTASSAVKCVYSPIVEQQSADLLLVATSLYNGFNPADSSVCGDGTVNGLEQCDPPNPGLGCSATCTVEAGFTCPLSGGNCIRDGCGNGAIGPGEQCDDGNTVFGDGCSGWCTLDQGWYCPAPNSSCTQNTCGDGVIYSSETCDDTNSVSGDGCSSTCTIEAGFTCVGQSNSVCTSTCGDGLKTASEACDDGNANSGDGCSDSCIIEFGFACSGTAPSACAATCGDAKKASSEPCDDGNLADGDGCSSSCTIEASWSCSGTDPSTCAHNCGNGAVEAGEQCDDANTASGDGCSSTCTLELGYVCSGAASTCTSVTSVCGDGIKAFNEQCDDGNFFAGDGCNVCTVETGFVCTGTSPSICTGVCGDGLSNRKLYTVSPPTNIQLNDAYYASLGCGLVPFLASQQDSVSVTIDGITDTYRPNSALLQTTFTNPSLCTFLSLTSYFDWSPDNGQTYYLGAHTWSEHEFKWFAGSTHRGGFVKPTLADLGDNQTQVDAWLARMSNRAYANIWGFDYFDTGVNLGGCCGSTQTPTWGQQLVLTVSIADPAVCDDGNAAASDGCSSTCSVETGWTCPETGACSPVCGDGLVKGSEQCDDGNTFAMDGCSPTCHYETNVCGDGVVNSTAGEFCDDGNAVSADGCSSACSVESGWTCPSPGSPCCAVSPNATRSAFAHVSAQTTANSLWFHTGPLRCHFLPPFGPDTVVTLQSATHTDYFRPRPSALSPVTTGTISACDFFKSNSKHKWSPDGTTYYQGMLGGSTATEFQYSTDPSTLGGSHPTTDPAWLAIFANRSQIPFWGLENSPMGHPYNISVTYGVSDSPCPTSAPTTTPAPTSTPAATQSQTTTPAPTQTPTPTPTQTLLAPSTPSPAAAPAPLPTPLLALAAALIAALLLGSQ